MKPDDAVIAWFLSEISHMSYGEVGIQVVVHDGKIVKMKKTIETLSKYQKEFNHD